MVLSDWKFWCLILGAAGALVMTLLNVSLADKLREQRVEVAQRAQFITESAQLSQFNSQFIQALAQLSAQTKDESIRELLAENGVTFTVNAQEDATAEENPDE